ncbi:UNKNOWN [Stylonychia lemnae]|uniref:PX domain-containing protein n=1 Tax=Stylonychia lemnae TaxID=5949 RepID=A0A078B2I3_STYLE|nr:UNKNOWN [Stylonychia lemnae]|eukprot:CDW88694.1 UNKNOWN [Stylonychia lemnae]
MDILNIHSAQLSVRIESHSLIGGVVFYHMQLFTSDQSEGIQINERYSVLHDFHNHLKKVLTQGTLKCLPSFPSRITLPCTNSESNTLKRQKKLQGYFQRLIDSRDPVALEELKKFALIQDHQGQRKIMGETSKKNNNINSSILIASVLDSSMSKSIIEELPDNDKKFNEQLRLKTLQSQTSFPKMSLDTQDTLSKESITRTELPQLLKTEIDSPKLDLTSSDLQFPHKNMSAYSNSNEHQNIHSKSYLIENTDFVQLCQAIIRETNLNLMKIGFDYNDELCDESLYEVQLTKGENIQKRLKLQKFEFNNEFFDIPKGTNKNIRDLCRDEGEHEKYELDQDQELLGCGLDDISQIINQDFRSLFKKLEIVSNFSSDSQ